MSDKQTAAMLGKKLAENTAQVRRGACHVHGAEKADLRSVAFAGDNSLYFFRK